MNFVRNYTVWTEQAAAEQMSAVMQELDAAEQHGLQVWLALAGVDANLAQVGLLNQIVETVRHHPALGVWKGADEPAHSHIPAAGCIAVYEHLRRLDPTHPVAVIEAPRAPGQRPGAPDRPLTPAALHPYAAACDIHGVDIYPVSHPLGMHAGGPPVTTDISVVGDVTRIVAAASPHKSIWTTLQIAWSGTLPPHPVVFPTLQQARFMAYDAVIAGARGLFFFGGQLKQAMNAADRARGWNWTYWNNVQQPLLQELSSPIHNQALLATPAPLAITVSAADIALSTREDADSIFLIAVRTSPSHTGPVSFHGLPAWIHHGTVLPHPGGNPERTLPVNNGNFTDPDPYRPHNARVYQFRRR